MHKFLYNIWSTRH